MEMREVAVRLEEYRSQLAADKRYIRRCPAVKFAARRRARAIGWARSLSISIHINRGIKGVGVPCGRR